MKNAEKRSYRGRLEERLLKIESTAVEMFGGTKTVLSYLVDTKNGRQMGEKRHRIGKTGEKECSGCGKLDFRERVVEKTVVDYIFDTHLCDCLPTIRFSALVLPSYREQFDFRLLFFQSTAVEVFGANFC